MKRYRSAIRYAIFILFASGINILCAAFGVRAEFPDKPINALVSFAAGGSSDMSFRALAIGAEKYLGQSIIIENKGGGGGTLALANIANAKPDGYTLTQAASTGIVRAPQMQKVTYKPLKSFTPIMAYVGAHNLLSRT